MKMKEYHLLQCNANNSLKIKKIGLLHQKILERYNSDEEIKLAYFKLARKYHPDLNAHPDSLRKFQEIQAAYAILGMLRYWFNLL